MHKDKNIYSAKATGTVIALLIISASAMGFRQLWIEGVFSSMHTPGQIQSVESKAADTPETQSALSEQDRQFLVWLEQQMKLQASQETGEIAVATDDVLEYTTDPVQEINPTTTRHETQMIKDLYSSKSFKEKSVEKPLKSNYKDKWFKDKYAKSDGSSEYKKISISKDEDVYINAEGDEWHVMTLPDGTTRKVQIMPDGSDGYISGGDEYAK